MKIAHKGDNLKEFNHAVKNKTLPELFPNLYENFKKKWDKLPPKAFEMLTRKGIYPYSYMDIVQLGPSPKPKLWTKAEH